MCHPQGANGEGTSVSWPSARKCHLYHPLKHLISCMHSLIYSFLHSFNKYLMSTYYIYCFRPQGVAMNKWYSARYHGDDFPGRGRRQQTHVIGCRRCFSIQGSQINVGTEIWRKWGRMPGGSLGESAGAGGMVGIRAPSQECAHWFLILQIRTNSWLSKVSTFLISCKIFFSQ